MIKNLKMKKNLSKKRGFTLVELLVVIVVIGLLFAVFVPRIDFASTSARETGVKSDFRSFELAAEQLLRENSGLAFVTNDAAGGDGTADIEKKLNKYLDPALQFSNGICAQTDAWNQNYKLYTNAKSGSNNGTITFVCSGKDSTAQTTTVSSEIAANSDDYLITVMYKDGKISAWTSGFSTEIMSQDTTLPTL